MRLEFSGAPDIPATREAVWARLTDPDFIAASAPGVERVEAVDPRHFRVTSGLGAGSMRLAIELDIELFDVVELRSLRMRAIGRGAGSNVDVLSDIGLEDNGRGGTTLRWSAATDVSGAIASLGGRMVELTARRLTEEFWSDFARRAGGV